MQSSELSWAGKLDAGLTKGLCLVLGWLINASIWLVGLWMLIDQQSQIFEYGEGLADVSWHEWGFMLLFVLLLWRHVRYCRHFATGFWRGLSRVLTFQGRLGCVVLALIGSVTGLDLDVITQLQGELMDTAFDPFIEISAYGLVLLVLYLAAPTTNAARSPAKPVASSRVEPTFITAEKEATA